MLRSIVPTTLMALLCSTAVYSAASSATVKIGFSGPLTGGQAVVGQEQLDGVKLAIELLDGKLGGQPVTVIAEDDQVKPEVGIQIVRNFLEREKVDVMVGLGYSNVLMANLKRIADSGTVAIVTAGAPAPMAGEECAPNMFSTLAQNDGFGEAVGKLMADKGYQNVYTLVPNYQAGKDMVAGFKRFYTGKSVTEIYSQVGQTDYSAELTQLQLDKPDAAFVFLPGSMGVNFAKQAALSGVLKEVPIFATFTVDGVNLPAVQEAAVGFVSANIWDASLDNPANKRFVKAFQERFKRDPSAYAASTFDAINLLDIAIRDLNGKIDDQRAFAAAVKAAGAKLESVRGPFEFGHNNMSIQNFYAFETVKDGDKVRNRLVATPLPQHKDAYAAKCPLGS